MPVMLKSRTRNKGARASPLSQTGQESSLPAFTGKLKKRVQKRINLFNPEKNLNKVQKMVQIFFLNTLQNMNLENEIKGRVRKKKTENFNFRSMALATKKTTQTLKEGK